ncbi:MAG: hypothetical protein WCL24_07470 [Verrucomicrobiota bacterium]
MSNTSNPSPAARKKCGCGKTKDAQGFCDGAHSKPVEAPARKKCGCGKTKDPAGFCDGSHAR